MKRVFCIVIAVGACSKHAANAPSADTLRVPGTANVYLAGQPDGSKCCSGDSAPAQSPVKAKVALAAGKTLTFSVTGGVLHMPGKPDATPDGSEVASSPATNGISAATLPFNALVGVFTGATAQATPPANIDFTKPDPGTSFTKLSPQLGQVFFIGDGLTGKGTGQAQEFVVPEGATALYLGASDSYGWANNVGELSVTIQVR
jgi:hypothetical protein